MKLALFLATGFEIGEATVIADLLRRADITVDLISTTNNLLVTSVIDFNLKADLLFEDANYDDYDGFILPGGLDGVNNLKVLPKLKKWLITAQQQQKIIIAICAAPIILAEFGLLKNIAYTVYPTCEKEITSGHLNTTAAALVDKNIFTAPSLGCVMDLCLKVVANLVSTTRALEMKKNLLFR